MRLLSAEARVKLADMRRAGWAMTTGRGWRGGCREISEAPLYIDDSPNLTMMEIRAKARRLKQKTELRLVVVDYLQLMTSGKRVESRQAEVAEFSRSLKLLAKELHVPVIAVSQLNRGPEQRTDKLPQLSDLRETGQLEQDADVGDPYKSPRWLRPRQPPSRRGRPDPGQASQRADQDLQLSHSTLAHGVLPRPRTRILMLDAAAACCCRFSNSMSPSQIQCPTHVHWGHAY